MEVGRDDFGRIDRGTGGHTVARVAGRATVAERESSDIPGLRMLALGETVVLAAGIVVLWRASQYHGDTKTAMVWAGILVLAAAILVLAGLTPVTPGRARGIQLSEVPRHGSRIRPAMGESVHPPDRGLDPIRNQESAQA